MRTISCFLLPALLLTCLLTACHTARKHAESGDYDSAIELCVRKLAGKSKKKIKYVQGLEGAFQKAQARDLALATNLANQNRDENWEKVNRIHRQIRNRQQRVSPLLPLTAANGYRARIELIDINQLENVSCEKAAEYLYTQAQTLLAKAERGDPRAACGRASARRSETRAAAARRGHRERPRWVRDAEAFPSGCHSAPRT